MSARFTGRKAATPGSQFPAGDAPKTSGPRPRHLGPLGNIMRLGWLLVTLYYGSVVAELIVLVNERGFGQLLKLSNIAHALFFGSVPPFLSQASNRAIVFTVIFVTAVVLGLSGFAIADRRSATKDAFEADKHVVVRSLTDALNRGDDVRVRVAAARSLEEMGELDGGASVTQLEAAVREAQTPGVRAAAISTLGKLKENAPIDNLITALRDPSPQVREAAATALGKLGERSPVEPLVARVREDQDTNVQMAAAAAALVLLRERVPVNVLMDTLRDNPDAEVRAAAAAALGTSGERSLREQPSSEVNKAILQDMKEVGGHIEASKLADALSNQ